MAWQIRPASLHSPITTHLDMAATTASNGAHSLQGNPMSKTPNLVQRQTGVYQYPAPMKLPPMVNVPKTNDPALPSRIQQPAPQPKPVK
jgi:hypothetical protein